MHELEIDVNPYGDSEEIKSNIRYTISLGLPELGLAPCSHDGTFVIVGSGPSLVNQVEALQEERNKGRPLCAINGAHDWLCEQGLTPDLFLTTDPRAMPHNRTWANDKTVYLIASRCHKDTVDALKDRNILVWHAWMDNPELDDIIAHHKMGIGGATTSGLRAVNVAYCLGYRKVHLYGMDSCLASKKGKKRFNCERGFEGVITDVIVGEETFWANMAMAQQARDFQYIWDVMPDMNIEVYGGGLLAAIIEERKKHNYPT